MLRGIGQDCGYKEIQLCSAFVFIFVHYNTLFINWIFVSYSVSEKGARLEQ
jgi:uncharacterized membrane protein YdbT with pleckstrin-like domain